MADIDKLRRAFATLSSLRQNLPENYRLHEKYIIEYHKIIDDLRDQKIDLDEFRIPEREVKPILVQSNYLTEESEYSRERYVEKAYFLMKLDALLGYFTLTIDDKKPRIGFKGGES